jgi:hypothetical protein
MNLTGKRKVPGAFEAKMPLRKPPFPPILCGKGQSAKVNETISHNLLIHSILPLKKVLEIFLIRGVVLLPKRVC